MSGALLGAIFGLSLSFAEITAGRLSGGRPPDGLGPFLAAYYAPIFALLALAAQVMARKLPALNVPGVLSSALIFVHTAIVLRQDLLTQRPGPVRWFALAAAAGIAACVFLGPPSRLTPGGSWLFLPFLLTWASTLIIGTLRGWPPAAAVPLFLVSLVLVLGAGAFLAAQVVGWRRARVVAVATLCVFVAWVWAGEPRTGPYLRDLPQALAASGISPRRQLNVVVIGLDTVRAANVSAYGYPLRTTPRLDEFASEAVRYTRCYSVAPWSIPSFASLFTGLLPQRHGADGPSLDDASPPLSGAHRLDDRFETLAEILSGEGYATAAVSAGVGLLYEDPWNLDQGFRYHDARPSRTALESQPLPLLVRFRSHLPSWLLADPLDDRFLYHPSAEEVTDRAAAWLRERRPHERPYLLFVHYFDVHEPYARGRRVARPGLSKRLPNNGLGEDAFREIVSGRRFATPEESAHLAALYDGALAYLDGHLGRLLDTLRQQPDYDATWIAITADHGDALGEHGTLGHRNTLYQEALWVPLVVRDPQSAPSTSASVNDGIVQQADLLPSVLDALQLPVPPGLDGRPFSETRSEALAVARLNPALARRFPDSYRRELRALIAGELKYIEASNAAPQLFDLGRDPGEAINLARERPVEAAALAGRLRQWIEELPRPAQAPERELPEGFKERLRALGYLP